MKQRIRYIDGLRGIACIIIFFSHIRLAFSHTAPLMDKLISYRPFYILVNGTWALGVFYLISSFVVSMAIFNNSQEERIVSLCEKRLFRLGLPIAFVFLISYGMEKVGLFYNKAAGELLMNPWLTELVDFSGSFSSMCKKVLIDLWVRADYGWINILSSIHTLFIGTFLCVIFALVLKKKNLCRVLLYTFILFEFTRNSKIEYSYFVIGCFSAWLMKYADIENWFRKQNKICQWGIRIALFAGFILAPAYGDIYSDKFARHGFESTVFAQLDCYYMASGFCLFFMILFSSPIKKLLEKGVLQYLGKLSYSIFLVHASLIASYSSAMYVWLREKGTEHYECTPIVFWSSTILLIVVAGLFYHFIERKTDKICSKILTEKENNKFTVMGLEQ